MSLVFSDTANSAGIVQLYEEECGLEPETISGNEGALKRFTVRVNLALADFLRIALTSSGRHQYDDSNYDDYPIIEADLTSGERDIAVTQDDNGALVLDYYSVLVRDPAGTYREIFPVDERIDPGVASFTDGQNPTGTPTTYSKIGNGIRFNVVPNYSWRQATEGQRGIKLYVSRETTSFAYTDTTKKPGIPAIFHKYCYLKPSLEYARRKESANYPQLLAEIQALEGDESRSIKGQIAQYFSSRPRDERQGMRVLQESNR